ncbi:hypothetical protein F2Q70_00003682 [Brassica cretica]|uniref:Uncharacterized protein n=2 Tax=Brassica cretica TaxID=69181 RepID=A0A3N6U0L8_BRACR|nr:hypothetical protein F2Q68_00021038 [Brassica cretica]KAF2575944.1 hypothetical protein F2Q70_00003682 [Brassica cretica]KAF3562087.1 hypothetical protein DY000_02015572 [Brassica cretica]
MIRSPSLFLSSPTFTLSSSPVVPVAALLLPFPAPDHGLRPWFWIDPVIQSTFCLKAAHITSALHRKYGKPHQEFVKSLCTYKDIFELRNRVEAFALQYELHAYSYQRDCTLVSATLSVGRQELYALFVEETLDLSSIHSLMENEKEGNGLTRSLGDSSRRDIFLVAQDQEICFGDVS